ncbi:MAG: AGE family epimerase/isomerase [Acidobacteria bacterium]|nr:AGE family epimerase/isomerase [Acidobacteriota bacterium]
MTLDFNLLRRQYRSLLVDGWVPFWFRHGIDWEHGGVLSSMSEDGKVLSGDKYIWSQARSVWTFSALYNRVERRPEFLEAAENSLRFLLAHGRDEQGRWVYRTDRAGKVLEGATSIYSDCFAVYGLSEYCRAVENPRLLQLALDTHASILERVERPEFRETAPYVIPEGRRIHAVPMILTEVTNELALTTGLPGLEAVADRCADQVMNRFLWAERGLLLEYLDRDYHRLPPPEGTAVVPGHAIESMWFVLHVARRRADLVLARRAAQAIRWHLEAGWDPDYGGIFLGIDAEGRAPFVPNAEKKLWWPHTEALYALLLAWHLTGERWCMDWYEKVHEWSFAHFPMPECGEWRQRLTRAGEPTTELVALPVKDPFHLPRAAMLITQLLGQCR